MQQISSNNRFKAVVVGNSADRFVCYAAEVLDEFELNFINYSDVYSAVGGLAKKSQESNVLVIGRFERLNRENGRFFDILRRNCMGCCCFVDEVPGRSQKKISAIGQAGIFIVTRLEQLRELLSNMLLDNFTCTLNKESADKASSFKKENFTATKAELNALFGN